MAELAQYMQEHGLNVFPLPKVILNKKPQDTESIFCYTGHYEPETQTLMLYVDGRHDKDILRSFAHELVHHSQMIRGDLSRVEVGKESDPKYAQNDEHLRKMEEEAYLVGNMMFRDWTDNKKYGK